MKILYGTLGTLAFVWCVVALADADYVASGVMGLWAVTLFARMEFLDAR
jgi:hypothetical protein